MTTDQAFCKSTGGGFGRSITCQRGKSITRISINCSKGKALSFPRRTWSSGVLHGLALVDLCLPRTKPLISMCTRVLVYLQTQVRVPHTHSVQNTCIHTHTYLFLPSLTLFCGPGLDLNCLSLCLPWNDLISLSVLEGEIFCI